MFNGGDKATTMSKDAERMSEKIMESKVLWYPDSKKNTQMDRFRTQVNRDFGLNLANYNDLYQWSVESYPEFWAEVWRFCGVVSSRMYEEVVDISKRISDIPEWFKGSRMNYAENLLKHKDQDKVALYAATEANDEITKVTFGELRRDVALFAAAMRKMGVETGDRVVGYLPNGIHAVEAMLAAASIGAIWSSTSVDFGVNGVLDRFSQIQPKLIFSVAAVVYNGKRHDHMEKLHSVVKGLPDLQKVVVIPYVRSKQETDLSRIPNSVYLDDFLATGKEGDQAPQLEFEQLPFSHPLFIMYSSGTTGAPKCMVHSAGGTLIQHLKEHVLHGNVTSSDVIIYYTTTGWMMWNWLVTSLAVGASVVLYDGSPLMPTPNVLWDLVDQLGITIFGTGAKWLAVLEERDLKPANTHALQTLHTILSTGSPLKPQSYEYVYRCIKNNVLLGSISGGTDIVSCFMGQNVTVPVYRGEIQTRNLGMAVEAWSCDGKPVWGESGELVCLKPIPCQPTYFWNDENGSKYHKAYFSSFPGVWAHGDYCKINPNTGGIVMLGRSDGTLNPNGVRFGSSEIYNIVEAFEEVSDSLCVPQYSGDGEERVILFLKMTPNQSFGPELVQKIRGAIRKALSARHVPALLLETRDIPYTLSGKKVEVAVKQVIAGREVTQRGAFSNPDSLDLYKNLPELQNF
ncbi:acetoacetyl-CoA synthetase isoform X2 [Coregonus clupeaformis]|uniref:acetoacetyl-CoA synthetase isoform X1 n=1 Tax=Coregonus clupeaformis TaxID=59861 RepID=UPI001BE045FD|nr:acetoacetyl-CoA synthetase isoform X1 [Coregonus clupeaformis]XP_045081541.1 acetoacetyl-CoA synthetase isoform X2 [Coregonus clupeaformis]